MYVLQWKLEVLQTLLDVFLRIIEILDCRFQERIHLIYVRLENVECLVVISGHAVEKEVYAERYLGDKFPQLMVSLTRLLLPPSCMCFLSRLLCCENFVSRRRVRYAIVFVFLICIKNIKHTLRKGSLHTRNRMCRNMQLLSRRDNTLLLHIRIALTHNAMSRCLWCWKIIETQIQIVGVEHERTRVLQGRSACRRRSRGIVRHDSGTGQHGGCGC